MSDNALTIKAVCTPAQAADQMKQYQALCKSVINEDTDISIISGKKYRTRSFWSKISRFFGLSVQITDERREDTGEKIIYFLKAKALSSSGNFFHEATGTCDSAESCFDEKNPFTEHKGRTKAEVRAVNRAVRGLMGIDEESAEEAEANAATVKKPEAKRPYWALPHDCPLCGNYLARGKNDPSTFYCTNYAGKHDGTPCPFPPKGRNKVAELDALIAEYSAKKNGETQPAAQPANETKERAALEQEVTILLRTKEVDKEKFWQAYNVGEAVQMTDAQLADAIAKLKTKPDKGAQQ
jgi:hypothetical protein